MIKNIIIIALLIVSGFFIYTYHQSIRGDVNHDGKVDNQDIQIVLEHETGWWAPYIKPPTKSKIVIQPSKKYFDRPVINE